jgi:tetratricopeptide (TPR) repeat protein
LTGVIARHVDAGPPTAASPESVRDSSAGEEELPVRLIDREPFDRVTLNAENEGAVIEVELLDLPERRIPNPLPTEGALQLRRLSDPSFLYETPWSAVARVELFETMLLEESQRLTAAGEFAEAFQYLAYLRKHYPDLPGLESALEVHLWREASTLFASGEREAVIPVLWALAQRNPGFPRLVNAVEATTNDIIAGQLERGDYAAARRTVETSARSFAALKLTNLDKWRSRFQTDAQRRLEEARDALEAKDYDAARDAVNAAVGIQPELPEAVALWREIQARAPEIRVGVFESASPADWRRTGTWAEVRIARLVEPRVLELEDFGTEGGVYRSAWIDRLTSDDPTTTVLRPSAAGRDWGLSGGALAREIAEAASPGPAERPSLALTLSGVQLVDGRDVRVDWRRARVRPEAILDLPLTAVLAADRREPPRYRQDEAQGGVPAPGAGRIRYRLQTNGAVPHGPELIVERLQADGESAVDQLARGDIDALDRVPPWLVEELRQTPGVVVGRHRLPTVHALIPNLRRPLPAMRDFRRATAYAVDRAAVIDEVFSVGGDEGAAAPLTGPFSAGLSLDDPAGYGHDPDASPWPYEPRLAMVLAAASRQALAQRSAEEKAEQSSGDASASRNAAVAPQDESAARPSPIVLAHATDPTAAMACQLLASQLVRAGLPVKLRALSPGRSAPEDDEWDYLYAELCVWEPAVDARRLFGEGAASPGGAVMSRVLDQLDAAENWNEVRTQLKAVNRLARQELPVIPLWQSSVYFARSERLTGVGESPVTLYQNVGKWRKSIP